MRSGWIGRQLRRMFLERGMIEVAVLPHQIFIGFEFLGLLIGGHLTRAQQAGTLNSADVKKWVTGEDPMRAIGGQGRVSLVCRMTSRRRKMSRFRIRAACPRLQFYYYRRAGIEREEMGARRSIAGD